MPIRPENKHLYPGGSPTSSEWKAIRAKILERAKDCCERCRAPNRVVVRRRDERLWGTFTYEDDGLFILRSADRDRVIAYRSVDDHLPDDGYWQGHTRPVRIIFTIAHLDHDPTNNDPENLRALCQRCHNRHDAAHRAAGRKERNP